MALGPADSVAALRIGLRCVGPHNGIQGCIRKWVALGGWYMFPLIMGLGPLSLSRIQSGGLRESGCGCRIPHLEEFVPGLWGRKSEPQSGFSVSVRSMDRRSTDAELRSRIVK